MRRALLVLLAVACGYRTPYQQQRSYADSLKPAEVHADPSQPARAMRVRVWVDADYRTETPRWEQHISAQLDRASDVLAAQFGVRLELESARPWDRTGPLPQLGPALEQLAQEDKGDGVEWVIGFVGSLAVFSSTQDQLGMAGLFGKQLVLRAMSSAGELDALNDSLKLLSGKEREDLARERRLHKETAVLLHEWAHTLGAIHDRAPDTFMAPSYDAAQAAFSPASAELVRLGLRYRGVRVVREAWAKAYREQLTGPGASYWDTAERDRALVIADAFFGSGAPPVHQETPPPLSAQDAKQLEQATLLDKAGDTGRALVLLEALAQRNPRNVEVQSLACTLRQEAGVCGRAAELPGASLNIVLIAAQLRITAGDRRGAWPLLQRAEAKLGPQPAAWLWLAQLEFAAGAPQAAERAAERAKGEKGAAQISAEAARMRHFVGFPRAALPVDQEADYVTRALAAHGQIDRRDYAGALASAADIARAFPDAPAAAVIACRVRSRGRAIDDIRRDCETAAERDPGAFLPQYILGLVSIAQSNWPEASTRLQHAIDIDGSTREVWSSLAAVEQRLHARPALRDLQARFQSRFGARLVPALFPAGWVAR